MTAGRALAIGDIHGCYQELVALLRLVAPSPEDTVVALGDYVDRGPHSYEVVQLLASWPHDCRLVALRGNHEQMMLQARDDEHKRREWLEEGGRETLASYSPVGDAGKLADVPDEHWRFLEEQCRDWFETPTHIFVHANLHPDLSPEEQPSLVLRWEKLVEPRPHVSGKTMVCGHTPQKSGEPLDWGCTICIDTAACNGGWLTCLDVGDGRYWQVNKAGERRTGQLATRDRTGGEA